MNDREAHLCVTKLATAESEGSEVLNGKAVHSLPKVPSGCWKGLWCPAAVLSLGNDLVIQAG